jgi:hypothetical protein
VQLSHPWHPRSPQRLPDGEWKAAVLRVRSEFNEMPCLRVTPEQARALFGLSEAADPILSRLAEEGFLVQTSEGQYVRRYPRP